MDIIRHSDGFANKPDLLKLRGKKINQLERKLGRANKALKSLSTQREGLMIMFCDLITGNNLTDEVIETLSSYKSQLLLDEEPISQRRAKALDILIKMMQLELKHGNR